MQKKLTITVDERVYDGLHSVVGRRRISQFIESLVRPYVVGKDLGGRLPEDGPGGGARSRRAGVGRGHRGRRGR